MIDYILLFLFQGRKTSRFMMSADGKMKILKIRPSKTCLINLLKSVIMDPSALINFYSMKNIPVLLELPGSLTNVVNGRRFLFRPEHTPCLRSVCRKNRWRRSIKENREPDLFIPYEKNIIYRNEGDMIDGQVNGIPHEHSNNFNQIIVIFSIARQVSREKHGYH